MKVVSLQAKAPSSKQVKKSTADGGKANGYNIGGDPEGIPAGPIIFNSYEILGELADERIAIWSKINSKTYKIATKDMSYDKIVQVAGGEFAGRVCRGDDGDKIPFRFLKRQIIMQASKTQLGDPGYLGQGINLLPNGKLLIVNGGEAWIWNGREFAAQETPLINKKFINWKPGEAWIDMDEVMRLVGELDKDGMGK